MQDLNVLDDEGVQLAIRLLTMRLSNEQPEAIVDHAIEGNDHLLEAVMFLLGIAARSIESAERWREVLLEEEQNGI